MNLNFRHPKAEELECKRSVSRYNDYDCILLYIRVETCTRILTETVGITNWTRTHSQDNKHCTVSIWDEDKKEWISKTDCGGAQTDIEGLKGQASTGFKRCCALNWGLGIELYSSPTILIPKNSNLRDLYVKSVDYSDDIISALTLCSLDGEVVLSYDMNINNPHTPICIREDTPTPAAVQQENSDLALKVASILSKSDAERKEWELRMISYCETLCGKHDPKFRESLLYEIGIEDFSEIKNFKTENTLLTFLKIIDSYRR